MIEKMRHLGLRFKVWFTIHFFLGEPLVPKNDDNLLSKEEISSEPTMKNWKS